MPVHTSPIKRPRPIHKPQGSSILAIHSHAPPPFFSSTDSSTPTCRGGDQAGIPIKGKRPVETTREPARSPSSSRSRTALAAAAVLLLLSDPPVAVAARTVRIDLDRGADWRVWSVKALFGLVRWMISRRARARPDACSCLLHGR